MRDAEVTEGVWLTKLNYVGKMSFKTHVNSEIGSET